jgi:nicotinamide-nucleotide amidase
MPDGDRPRPGSDEDLVHRISTAARAGGLRLAVAESLTCGRISSALGSGEGAAEWYRGAVVAYDAEVKFTVLGVTPGPVVTQECAREMAEGVRRLLQADLVLAITGVGGPGPDEGCPAGTVHLTVATAAGTHDVHTCLPGDPTEVVASATSLALAELAKACAGSAAG